MTTAGIALPTFLASSPTIVLVKVTEALGSTPREQGAFMLVSPTAIFGTIGGGHLEFVAIDKARALIAAASSFQEKSDAPLSLDIALGPEMGQCCGGRVVLDICLCDDALRAELVARSAAENAALPAVYLFGGGHVGHALASSFSLLPVRVVVVETRADALEAMPQGVETRLTAMPEEAVRSAPSGAAFLILTHDHALDFLIVAEALRRTDAAYVGMIGSKTKKATFRNWYLKSAGGDAEALSRLVSPIGGDTVRDKRPAVIAALAAAEVIAAVLARKAEADEPVSSAPPG